MEHIYVYVQEGDEQCRVLGLRAGESLLVLLLAERSTASAELLTGLSEVALPLLRSIAQSTAAELADAKQWHIPGYRLAAASCHRAVPDTRTGCSNGIERH